MPASIARRATTTSLTLLLVAAALLLAARPAGALPPVGTGVGTTIPVNLGPTASFTISPNPAFVTLQPVAAQARVAIGPGVGVGVFNSGGQVVTFDASASSAASGIASYAWDLDGDGTYETSGATARVETKRFYRTGTFTIRLRVTDRNGTSSVTSHTLIVHRAPTAAIHTQRTVGFVNQEFKLSPSGSNGDPEIATYHWHFEGGRPDITTDEDEIVPATFSTPGPHTVTLTITDTLGATATATIVLTAERAPDAEFTQTPVNAFVGEPITFDASSSTADSAIVDYRWDLDGDGTYETDTDSTPTVTTTYTTPGTRQVGLEVIDANGLGGFETHDVTVYTDPAAAAAAQAAAPLAHAARLVGAAARRR